MDPWEAFADDIFVSLVNAVTQFALQVGQQACMELIRRRGSKGLRAAGSWRCG